MRRQYCILAALLTLEDSNARMCSSIAACLAEGSIFPRDTRLARGFPWTVCSPLRPVVHADILLTVGRTGVVFARCLGDLNNDAISKRSPLGETITHSKSLVDIQSHSTSFRSAEVSAMHLDQRTIGVVGPLEVEPSPDSNTRLTWYC